jgi:hypothetical protein
VSKANIMTSCRLALTDETQSSRAGVVASCGLVRSFLGPGLVCKVVKDGASTIYTSTASELLQSLSLAHPSVSLLLDAVDVQVRWSRPCMPHCNCLLASMKTRLGVRCNLWFRVNGP